ncbi:MAG: putative quinol monooxygenase, partial [Streptosporangiaceae bacterium]
RQPSRFEAPLGLEGGSLRLWAYLAAARLCHPRGPTRRQAIELMIFIVVKWTIRPERSAEWLSLVEDFTQDTRNEPGNIFFEWSRSVDDPHQFILVEAFKDDAAAAHVNSDHFKKAMSWVPDVVARKPQIINVTVPGESWSEMAEVAPR